MVRHRRDGKRREHRQIHYWLIGRKSDGQPLVTYGGSTEQEARVRGFQMFEATDFDIIPLPTRDQATATSMWKRQTLEQTGNPDVAMRRTSHIPEKQYREDYF